MDRVGRRPVPRSPRAPLRRGAVIAAGEDLRDMVSVLTGGLPIDARGAAMASWLLRYGTGPLYNHRPGVELGSIVREATRQMAHSLPARRHCPRVAVGDDDRFR